MRVSRLGWNRRLTAVLIVGLVAAILVAVSGSTPATAAGEQVSFVTSSSTTIEGAVPTAAVRLNFSGAQPLVPVVATLTAVPGSTADPAEVTDFALAPTTVTFPVSSINGATALVPITFPDDNIFEHAETVDLTIVSVSGGTVGAANTHTVTIANNDELPTVEVLDSSAAENADYMVFTVSRIGRTELAATAIATPSDGTASGSSDYSTATQPVSIPAGGATGSTTFSVALNDDLVYEGSETFNVALSALDGATAVGSVLSGVGTITENEPVPKLSIGNIAVSEAGGNATFTIIRKGATALNAEFDIATSNNTAEAGADYTSSSDTLSIAPGTADGTVEFEVPIVDDDFDEDNETYRVNLSSPVNATVATATAFGTILDNDQSTIEVDPGNGVTALEGGAPDTFSVSLGSEPSATVSVAITNTDGEVAPTPTSLSFAPSDWDTAQSVSVSAIEDGIDEPDPHSGVLELTASSADAKYDLASTELVVTVGDADALLVTIDGPSVGLPGQLVRFTAEVSAGGSGEITYAWKAFYEGNEFLSGDQSEFQFTPADGGSYVVQVVVGDEDDQNPVEFLPFRAIADVAGSVFANDILWLAENEITKGCNPPVNDQFCPRDIVTRGQMAAFMVRALDLIDDGGGNTFADDDGSIFEQDIAKLAAAGITRGCNPPDNTNFCPNDGVTREQMAAFMRRADALE